MSRFFAVNAWTGGATDTSARTRIPARTNELFMDVLSPDRYCGRVLIRVLMAGDFSVKIFRSR
jgi:hypothetical protein